MASNSDTPGASEAGSENCSTGGRNLTPTELGKLWGTSRAYASKCIKNGCPTSSLGAAIQWRQARARYGIGYRSKHKPAGAPSIGSSETASASATGNRGEDFREREPEGRGIAAGGLDSLEGSLRKAISVENEAHRLVEEAQRAKNDETISIRIAAYTKAQKGRLDAEEQIVKLKEKLGLLISGDKAKELIRKAFFPLLTRLRSLPKRAAFKANPIDDVHAEAVLKQEIEELIGEWRGLYRGADEAPSLRKDSGEPPEMKGEETGGTSDEC